MSGWKTYEITPVPFVRRELRMFYFADAGRPETKCPGGRMSEHDASVTIDAELPMAIEDMKPTPAENFFSDDRWPVTCGQCGAGLPPDPIRQVNNHRLYTGFADGKLRTLHDKDIAPGAIYHADWADDAFPCFEGCCYAIVLPGGHAWMPGCPAVNSKTGWTISGPDFLHLTASPSINHPGIYHGWLAAGILSDDCEGRKFPQWPYTEE